MRRGAYLGPGLAIVGLLVLTALLAPWLVPLDPHQVDLARQLAPPSVTQRLGADENGRDVLALLVHGARVALLVSLPTTLLTAAIGIPIGAIAGYRGGWRDELLSRTTDLMLAFPGMLLSILLLFLTQKPGYGAVVLALVVNGWAGFARLTRGEVMRERARPYVEAGRALGLSDARLLWRHVLPNCASALLAQASFAAGTAILAEAGLSFLGLGPYGAPSWGALLDQGASYFLLAPHLAILPGLAILATVLGFNLIGDGLRDHLDPHDGSR
jgi:peptide/nickel transport system permease protein